MKKIIFSYLFLGMLLTACNSSSTDSPDIETPTDAYYDFVTLLTTTESASSFTLRQSADSPVITYTSTVSFSKVENLKDGDRLIIMYTTNGRPAYTSGPITLYGYRLLDNTANDLILSDGNNADFRSDGLKIDILTRTGSYINVMAQLSCHVAGKPQKLEIVADASKIDAEIPDLYLVYISGDPGVNFYTGYASFDISKVWDLPTCKGVNIIYQGLDSSQSMKFTKPNTTDIITQ